MSNLDIDNKKRPILQFKNSGLIKEKLASILPPELLGTTANNNKKDSSKKEKIELDKLNNSNMATKSSQDLKSENEPKISKIEEKIEEVLKPSVLSESEIEAKTKTKTKAKNLNLTESSNSILEKKKKSRNKNNYIPESRYEEIYEELSEKFPNLFNKDDRSNKKVLKIGISDDIKNHPEITWSNIYKKFLLRYTRSSSYRKSHIVKAFRYDLLGNVSGEVTEEECQKKQEFMFNRKTWDKTSKGNNEYK